ncbi:hypothetical protein MU476_14975, partial [Staphylococcus aureus]
MKACLYLSNDKFVEIDNLEKVIKSGHRGTVEISKEKIKSSLFTNGSYTCLLYTSPSPRDRT